MKKKLLTLLTLALCVCSGAWANSEWILAEWPSGATSFNGLTYYASGEATALATFTTDKNTPAWTDKSTYKTYYSTNGSSTFQTGKDNNRIFEFTVSAADLIKVYFMGGGSGNRSMYVSYEASSSNRDTETAFGSATADGYTPTILSAQATAAGTVYLWTDANVRIYAIKVESTTNPQITATDATVTAKTSGVAATASIDVKGVNLTGSTLTATLSPAVEGLSVSLASSEIADGTITTKATVSYTSSVNVPTGTTTLTLSDGTTTKEVNITYSANVSTWTLQSVSTSKTWDFSKLTINKSSECYNSKDDAIKLDGTTTPTSSDEIVYANYDGDLFTIGSSFDGTAIAFKGQYPIRKNSYVQNGTLRFSTTVPGKLVVKFSDTGSSASETAVKRYLVVNGEQTEYWASRENNGTENPYSAKLNVTSGAIPVPAGDVTISGSSAIVISYVEFTAMPASVSGTITVSGYNTYSSNYPLDLSTISGGTAYVATSVTDGKVVLTKCTDKVPAATGLFIAGTANDSFTISTTAEATAAPAANLFVGLPSGGTVNKADEGEYNYVFGWESVDNPGFYLINATAATLGNFKAYLHSTSALSAPAGARLAIIFDDQTTGIAQVESEMSKVEGAYNLNGQRVAAPQKGLYIVNGKKVIIK